ncbi:MAG: hypothetical protein H6Q59_1099 [Firmicutes bacterium]|nr:hypothetical protein [Bacillota bacterium]
MITLSIPSRADELNRVLDFINMGLEVFECSVKIWKEISETVESIFLSVATYAYPYGEGIVKISLNYIENQQAIEILFYDEGIPYNPLENICIPIYSHSGYQPESSGGVSLLTNCSEKTCYVYLNEKNITTVKKYLV